MEIWENLDAGKIEKMSPRRDIPGEERHDVEQVASRVQRVKRAVCEVEIAKGDHGRVICKVE